MSSHKIAFPNPFQAKDAQGGASNFQKRDLRLDFYEARFLYCKKLRGFSCFHETYDLLEEDMICCQNTYDLW